MTNYPAALDVLTNPSGSNTLDNPNHADQHINANDAIEALQAKVGVDGSADTDSLDYKVANSTKNTDTSLSGNSYFLDEDTMSSNDATKVASQQSIKAYVDSAITAAKAALFPVGAIYVSGVATNPATLLGFGTWTQIEGKFLVGVSTTDTDFDLDDTGGAKTVTLTTDEMPSHTHTQNAHSHFGYHRNTDYKAGTGDQPGFDAIAALDPLTYSYNGATSSTTATNQNTGGGAAHENLPPFIAKYIWQRTA